MSDKRTNNMRYYITIISHEFDVQNKMYNKDVIMVRFCNTVGTKELKGFYFRNSAL